MANPRGTWALFIRCPAVTIGHCEFATRIPRICISIETLKDDRHSDFGAKNPLNTSCHSFPNPMGLLWGGGESGRGGFAFDDNRARLQMRAHWTETTDKSIQEFRLDNLKFCIFGDGVASGGSLDSNCTILFTRIHYGGRDYGSVCAARVVFVSVSFVASSWRNFPRFFIKLN